MNMPQLVFDNIVRPCEPLLTPKWVAVMPTGLIGLKVRS